jgi:hypothetical protein
MALPTGATWREAGYDALPTVLKYHTCLNYGGYMWAIGGSTATATLRKVLRSADGATWSEVGSNALPVETSLHCSQVFLGKMWVVGGWNGTTIVKKVYSSTDGATWTESGTDVLPVALRSGASAVLNGRMWLVGGYNGTAGVDTVYSTADGITWDLIGTIPVASRSHGLLSFGGLLWLIGGYSTEALRKVYSSPDGTTGSWTEAGTSSLPNTWYGGVSLAFDSKMWIVCGILGVAGTAFVYSSTNGITWTLAGAVTAIGKYYNAGVVFGDKIWVVGNYNDAGVSDRKVFYSADAFSARKTLLGVGV